MVELYVVADIYLRVLAGGEASKQYLGSLFQYYGVMTSMERCETFRDKRGQRGVAFIEDTARTWWMEELNVPSDDLIIDAGVQCHEQPS